MAYVLVNMKDESRRLDINNEGWWALRVLLIRAGWEPMGATGHWDIETDTHFDVSQETESDRWSSYEGCCLQRVCDEDARAMLEAARLGIRRCENDPDGTFRVFQVLQPAERDDRAAIQEAARRGILRYENNPDGTFRVFQILRPAEPEALAILTAAIQEAARLGMLRSENNPDGTFRGLLVLTPVKKPPASIAESVNIVRSLLQDFAEFAEHGAFFVD